MKRLPTPILAVLLAAICLVVGACGAPSTGGSSGGHTTGGSSSAPTATTAKPGPTAVPVASVAECGKLLSLSEANQDTHPVSPATLLFPLQISGDTLCYYESATHQPNLALIFKAYSGGNLSQNIQSQLSGSGGDFKVVNSQTVSGVGDQAEYVTTTGTSSVNGATVPAKENILFVVDGGVSFGIINTIINNVDPLGSASDSAVLSDFEQVAQTIISAL
jgi:hypothetical protein